MKAILTCIEGLEEVVIKEIKGKKLIPTKIILETTPKDLAKIASQSRSILGCYQLLKKFKFKTQEDIEKQKLKIPYKFETFAVRCKDYNHNFSSQEIEHAIGQNIKGKADLKNPQLTIIIEIIENLCLIGIDFLGTNISKRDYRIKTNPFTVNSTIAYALFQVSGFKPKETLLDPYCKEGSILIETVLSLTKTPHQKELAFQKFLKYKMPKPKKLKLNVYGSDHMLCNIKATEINSQLANIKLNLTLADTEWLDTKFKKNQIDKIVTVLDRNSNINELAHQSEYILKDSITVLTRNIIKLDKFKTVKQIKIKHGTEELYIQKLKKTL